MIADFIDQLTDDEPIRQIAASILLQAMEDWVQLMYEEEASGKPHDQEPPPKVTITKNGHIRKRRKNEEDAVVASYAEIREFFKSDHFQWVCDIVDIDPAIIVSKMEGWLKTYRRNGTLPSRRYHKLRTGASR